MKLLGLITWPYVRKRKLRVLLTVLSITMGVALLAAMRLGSQTVLGGFQNAVDRVAGATQLQVTAGDNGFSEEALERVQDLAEVAVASPVIEALVQSDLPGQGSILIVAVDFTGDQKLRRYDFDDSADAVEDPLVFMAHADSLVVSRRLADRAGLRLGSELPLETAAGRKRFVVRGILREGGLAEAFGGSLAVMDLYAAQKVFGRGRMLDRIDIGVAEGVSVADCRRRVQEALGPGYQVEEPAGLRRGMQSLTRALSLSIDITEMFALMVAVFIIYNTFSMAAVERRREIGILRALGASRAGVIRLFLLEGALAGTLGALAGIPLGAVLARGVTQFLDFLVRAVYGFRLSSETPRLSLEWALFGIGAGIAAAIAGAAAPAWTAANEYVAAALRGERAPHASGLLARYAAGALSAAASIACLGAGAWYPAYALAVFAAILLAPAATGALVRAAAPLLKALRPVEGAFAADSLLRHGRRTSATVTALMLALAMAVGVAGLSLAMRSSIREWVDNGMTFDLYVTAEPTLTERSLRFPASFRVELESVAGVEEAHPLRMGRVPFRDTQVMLLSTDVARLARRIRFKLVEGDLHSMVSEAAAGRGAIISESLSLTRRLHLGDTLEIGGARLPIVGVHVDYTDQQGSVLVDRSVYLQHWKDESADAFRLYLAPGARQDAVRQAILDRFSTRGRLFVMTTADVKGYILRIADQWFALTYIQLAVALLVAVLGIVNNLTVSVLDRGREFGVLQAVGGLPWQVRSSIWMESGAIAAVGVVLGVALGGVMLWFNLCIMRLDSFGHRLDYTFPTGFAALLLPIVLAAAFLASIGPAESAVRRSLVEALEYE